MAMDQMRDRDLVLPPNTHAFVLDSTKGRISVYVGPYKSSLSTTDRMVIWDGTRFEVEDDFDQAVSTFITAAEGEYVILANPAAQDAHSHPPTGTTTDTADLSQGRRTIIPGPTSFPLWPGQEARVIQGHHLRSNQYLIVRVYEPEQAQRHAEAAVVAPQGGDEKSGDKKKAQPKRILGEGPLTIGQLLVIRGTDVSFFIPPTGIEVVPGDNGEHVRAAVTLEAMEYTILLDEDGEKRYLQGPAVVFPEPTEQFVRSGDNEPKARAIELNTLSGLYIKVIADYTHEDPFDLDVYRGGQSQSVTAGQTVCEGDELFITGRHTPIYFPRPEHMLLTYRGQRKHHAIAIPRGEGRYALDRETGNIQLVRGPEMYLPDPRTGVIVQRILSPGAVETMYPGNNVALAINQQLAQQGSIDNLLSGQELASDESVMAASTMPPPAQVEGAQYLAAASYASTSAEQVMRTTKRGGKGRHGHETQSRGTTHTKPRTIVLDTKYQGAVEVEPWPGYAVLVTDRAGKRRVELGPQSLLLEYDESLMTLSLSTGRPKSDQTLYRTVYLRVINNTVSDQVMVETADLVPVTLALSYRVNFVGEDPLKWFDVENYVGLLTDHCRSRLRNVAKRYDIKTFFSQYIDIVRNAVLGEAVEGQREGLRFAENSMHVYDVEVLGAEINEYSVAQLLTGAMTSAMEGAIMLSTAEDETTRNKRLQALTRDRLTEIEKTRQAEAQAALAALERDLAQQLKDSDRSLNVALAEDEQRRLLLSQEQRVFLQNVELQAKLDAIEVARGAADTAQFVARMDTLKEGVIDALQNFGDKEFVTGLLEAVAPLASAMGITTGDIMHQWFKGTPFENVFGTLAERPYAKNGHELAPAMATE